MERIQKITKEVDAILTSDWHLREDLPICRKDDFVETTQWKKVDFISALQKKYNCPVLHGGDLFDKWKPSPWLLSKATQHLPDQFYTVFGNHDLPQHSLELQKRCGIYNLWTNNKLHIAGVHWGQKPTNQNITLNKKDVILWHIMTYQGKRPWPGCTDPSAAKLLRLYPRYDLILTGDNHKPFVEEYEGRLLVNPGSIFRMDADQIDHLPRVYLWHAEDNTVTPVYIPIDKDAVSREHLDVITQRNDRIDSFISKLDGDWEISLSFEDNLEKFKQSNKIKDSVMEIIYTAMEEI